MPAITNSLSGPAEYRQRGYAVYRGLIDSGRIDALLAEYATTLRPSRLPLLRQSASGWLRHRFTPTGHMADSVLNPHCLPQPELQSFVEAVLAIYAAPALRAALSELNGDASTEHTLAQSMFFDANTGTLPHQDCYYLDSLPGGSLIGVWIALENIAADAGRFYVLPGSHLNPGPPNDPHLLRHHSAYLQAMQSHYDAQPPDAAYAPALNKGDVLFWHVNTIHGSQPTANPELSRKSLTAHYLPTGLGFGNMRGQRIRRKVGEHAGLPFFQWKLAAPRWPGLSRLYSAAQHGRLIAQRLLSGRLRD